MIGNQTDGNILLLILMILCMCQFANLIANCLHGINIEYGIHILHYNRKTLQSHAGIDVLLYKFCIVTFSISFVLSKYIVPYFHKAVAVAAHFTVRLSTAVLLSSVVINLCTWTAWTSTVFPEIITVPILITIKSCDSVFRNSNFLIPDAEGFIILKIDRWIKSVFFKSKHFCQKFPRPVNRLMLEIIPKGKITKHFKKRKMSCRLSDILDISRPDTFLAGSDSSSWRNLLSCKIRF